MDRCRRGRRRSVDRADRAGGFIDGAAGRNCRAFNAGLCRGGRRGDGADGGRRRRGGDAVGPDAGRRTGVGVADHRRPGVGVGGDAGRRRRPTRGAGEVGARRDRRRNGLAPRASAATVSREASGVGRGRTGRRPRDAGPRRGVDRVGGGDRRGRCGGGDVTAVERTPGHADPRRRHAGDGRRGGRRTGGRRRVFLRHPGACPGAVRPHRPSQPSTPRILRDADRRSRRYARRRPVAARRRHRSGPAARSEV